MRTIFARRNSFLSHNKSEVVPPLYRSAVDTPLMVGGRRRRRKKKGSIQDDNDPQSKTFSFILPLIGYD